MDDSKEEMFRTSVTVSAKIQAAAMVRYLSEGGSPKSGFNGAAVAALEEYSRPAEERGNMKMLNAEEAEIQLALRVLRFLREDQDSENWKFLADSIINAASKK